MEEITEHVVPETCVTDLLRFHYDTRTINGIQVERKLLPTEEDQVFLYYSNFRLQNSSQPKANLIILHEIQDHCQRYNEFAYKLAQQSYEIHLIDFMGYGHSDGLKCGIKDPQVFVKNLKQCLQQVTRTTENVFIYGHGLGAAIGLTWHLTNQLPQIRGIITEGLWTSKSMGRNGASSRKLWLADVLTKNGLGDFLISASIEPRQLLRNERALESLRKDKQYDPNFSIGLIWAGSQFPKSIESYLKKFPESKFPEKMVDST
jgi:alpha-beta hydrolase superfamily lysophospholipase